MTLTHPHWSLSLVLPLRSQIMVRTRASSTHGGTIMHVVALATMCVVVVGVSEQLPAPRRLRTEFQPPDEMALSVPTDGLRLSWQVSEQPHLCVCVWHVGHCVGVCGVR
jgi:hypothetical protein